jgi:hypothetical protein
MARLSPEQYREWVGALNDVYAIRSDAATLVRMAINKNLDQVVPGIDLQRDIEILVRKADNEGWLDQLLNAAREHRPNSERIRRLATQLEVINAVEPVNPIDATRISGMPMVDRIGLRASLYALETDGAAPILVVDGARLSGKTQSSKLIGYVASKREGVHLVAIDLEEYAYEGVIKPALVGRLIAEQGDLGVPPEPNEEQTAQWINQYCNWLTPKIKAAGGKWWVVIDHFDKVLVHPTTLELMTALAQRITRNLPSLRLVLLAYPDRAGLEVAIGRVEHETIGRIDRDQLRDGLARFFSAELLARHVATGSSPDRESLKTQIAEAIDHVLVRIRDDDPERLLALRDAVREELGQLPMPVPGGG